MPSGFPYPSSGDGTDLTFSSGGVVNLDITTTPDSDSTENYYINTYTERPYYSYILSIRNVEVDANEIDNIRGGAG